MDQKNRCPRCGGGIPNNETPGAYPGAISRWDNATEVCSGCGADEAMLQFFAARSGEDVAAVLHPATGEFKWVVQP
jgi:hypothetical protein